MFLSYIYNTNQTQFKRFINNEQNNYCFKIKFHHIFIFVFQKYISFENT